MNLFILLNDLRHLPDCLNHYVALYTGYDVLPRYFSDERVPMENRLGCLTVSQLKDICRRKKMPIWRRKKILINKLKDICTYKDIYEYSARLLSEERNRIRCVSFILTRNTKSIHWDAGRDNDYLYLINKSNREKKYKEINEEDFKYFNESRRMMYNKSKSYGLSVIKFRSSTD